MLSIILNQFKWLCVNKLFLSCYSMDWKYDVILANSQGKNQSFET